MASQLFINNEWVEPVNGNYFPVINPFDNKPIGRAAAGDAADISKAVAAAKAALPSWKKTPPKTRAKFLRAMAAGVQENYDELVRLETIDTGKPFPEAEADMDDVIGCFEYYADLAETLDSRQWTKVDLPDEDYAGYLRYEPIGVVGAIIPWNYPLLMALWKVGPCLAAGCTMVLKPSELTPLTAIELGKIALKAGLPAGVLNIVTGFGADAGAPLVADPRIAKVAFTGSVPTGSAIMAQCAKGIKTVSLELGGKSPAIVFPSADMEKSIEWVMAGCFWTNGQICSATSRLLIHDSIADQFLDRLVAETNKIVVGDPLDPNTLLGPLVCRRQQQKVQGFIHRAMQQGATISCGGYEPPVGLEKGCFVKPTIITGVEPWMEIWKEEVFGPVLSVMRFSTEEEAIQLANDCKFGLGGAIFSNDQKQLDRVAEEMEVGIVWRNCAQPTFVQLPWGGQKQSGIGRELGPFGLNAYLEVKQVCDYVSDAPLDWYFNPSSRL